MKTTTFKKKTGRNLLLMLFFIVMSFQAKAQPSIGDGSSNNPYQIATLADLKWVADQVNGGNDFSTNGNFIQTANIDASATSTWNPNGSDGYYGWTAIGGTDDYYVFSGSYDGQGYTISNLYINNPSVNVYGLFGYCSGATIKNLGLTNVSMIVNSDIGGLVGYMEPGTIINCYVTGSVKASGGTGYAGGLCAEACKTNIDNCYAACTVVAEKGAAGGLIAYMSVGSITNSYSSGSVTVNSEVSYVGGLLGSIRAGTSVESCFSESSVSANGVLHREPENPDFSNVGGFIGSNEGTVTNCYAKGSVTGLNAENESKIGGLLGKNTGTVSYCYSACSLSVTPLSGNTPAVGGFVGANYDESSYGAIHYPTSVTFEFTPGTVDNNCYWNSEVYANGCGSNNFTYLTPYTATFLATGKSTTDMKTTTFAGWNTPHTPPPITIWNFTSGSYPQLNWNTIFKGSGNWLEAGKWSNGIIPGLNYGVTIDGFCTVNESTCAKNLTMNSTSSLTINAAKSLGVNNNLTLKSDAGNTASLINNGTVAVSGTINAERYMTRNKWHVVSPTAAGGSISTFIQATGNAIPTSGSNYGMMDYNETTNTWKSYFTTATGDNLIAGTGYSVRRSSDGAVTFTGTLTSGTKSVSLTKGGEGWNCVGNPYPSAINMNTTAHATNNFITQNSSILDGSYACVYVWDEDASYSGGQSCYKIISNSGFISTTGRANLGQDYVAPGQGFFVKARNPGTNITFTAAMQVHQSTTELKSGKTSWPGFQLTTTTAQGSASTIITFNNAMTTGLDVTYDAGLLRGSSGLELYSRLVTDNGVDFAIQCLPESYPEYSGLVIPLGLDCKTGGEVTFSAETVELPAACSVILEDKTTKTFTSLAGGATYKATVPAGATGTGRFYIHTNDVISGVSDLPSAATFNLKVYPANGEIIIEGEVSNQAKAALFDLNGKKLGAYALQGQNRNTISVAGVVPGVYLLNVTDSGKRFSTKIVIE